MYPEFQVCLERSWATQVRKGLVELTVLAAVGGVNEAYGYELLQRLAAADPLLVTTESTLYPALARLSDDQLLAVRQVPSQTGPPRRYYRLTAAGRRRLAEMSQHWNQMRRAVDALLLEAHQGD